MVHHQAVLLSSWIETKCMQSAAVGKAACSSIYWQDTAYRLVILEPQTEFAQLYKYHHQSGERQLSLKPALV